MSKNYTMFDAATPASVDAVRAYAQKVTEVMARQNEVVAAARKLGATRVAATGDREMINGFAFSGQPPAGWRPLRGINSPMVFFAPPQGSEWEARLKSCSMPLLSKYIEGLSASFAITDKTVKWARAEIANGIHAVRVPDEMKIAALPGFVARNMREDSHARNASGNAPLSRPGQ